MKYYEQVPENFLLIRLVPTRKCNFRCPYCYLDIEQRTNEKSMFSHHVLNEWLTGLKNNFSDRFLEFYFTGGEPLLIADLVKMTEEVVSWANVKSIRIDSNLMELESFLNKVDSLKISFLASFHPLEIDLARFLEKARVVNNKGMLGMVNFVASGENLKVINMSLPKLIQIFEDEGMFLNIAKDFQRGVSMMYGYQGSYINYINSLQNPIDVCFLSGMDLNRGKLCGSGKHYISINRHGQVFSCGNKEYRQKGFGNIFENTVELPDDLHFCKEECCPSIISYSFSCSNDFLPVNHISDYVNRSKKQRMHFSENDFQKLWSQVDIKKIHNADSSPSIFNKVKRKLRGWMKIG